MQKDFYESVKIRTKVLNKKSKNIKGFKSILYIISKILCISSILPYILACSYFVPDLGSPDLDWGIPFTFLSLAFVTSGILWTIGFAMGRIVQINSLTIWTGMFDVELHLTKNGVIQGNNSPSTPYFQTYFMEYNDIVDLIYDKENYLFKIIGKYSWTSWDSNNRNRIINETEKGAEIVPLIFLTYFENFNDFISQIEEKTGLKVKYQTIKLGE